MARQDWINANAETLAMETGHDDILGVEFRANAQLDGRQGNATNAELAESLLAAFSFRVNKQTGQLLVYNDREGIYQDRAEALIRSRLERAIPDISKNRKSEIVTKIKDMLALEGVDFDNFEDWLHCQNGWVDINTEKFKEHSPEMCSMRKIPIDYKFGATCPEISKFLYATLTHEDVLKVERMIGYCLLPSTKFEKAFMLVGEGANGKSTLINLVKALVGAEQTTNQSLQELGYNRYKPAELYGKMVNLFADLKAEKINDAGYFKMLVSGDRISAERKYGQPFNFENKAKLIFSTNKIPETSDESYAYFRRWVIVPFNQTFEGDNRDAYLLEKITIPQELSGLLNLALMSLRKLVQEGGFEDSDIEDIKSQYQLGASKIEDFIRDCCVLGEEQSVKSGELNNALFQYSQSKGSNYMDKQEAGKKLKTLGIMHKQKRVKGQTSWFYFGIGLKGVTGSQANSHIPFTTFKNLEENSDQKPVTPVTTNNGEDQQTGGQT